MAFPLPRGTTPSEIGFLAEMEMVTVVPRQRLEGLELLGGPIEPLVPPRRASLPLWLALLLKRQRRANIMPPAWLHPEPLSLILEVESQHQDYKNAFSPPPPLPGQPSVRDIDAVPTARPQYTPDGGKYYASPPFLPQNTAQTNVSPDELPALPFHWLEIGNMLLESASDDLVDSDQIRRLMKDLREVRLAKMRAGTDVLDAAATGGGGVALTGVGAMEVGEERGFLTGVVDNLRKIGASKEQARREQMAEQRANGGYDGAQDDDEEDYMEF
ncbi:GINS complex subunit Psf2 subgroup [Penicillium citrinum]|uniref:DNA replication complex GINS protein PSF2 n=2 Tax=Penicillium TaxID=5073 RepID=A0A9W9TXN1_PENCI|nr:GINS complex subunit Psf2 subgroup [Penicillium citrinum]KAJ5243190.1 GINS complex subunit Psf2 subgroup [Penicillium citrinum]KAJ5599307.1 GINS complex subunit Psf2 subgroup [Penicillium hetheringtonii]